MPGQGSTFTLRLPDSAHSEDGAAPAGAFPPVAFPAVAFPAVASEPADGAAPGHRDADDGPDTATISGPVPDRLVHPTPPAGTLRHLSAEPRGAAS
jgi:hypothetical protein